ncbi:MAG: hypothetical protein GVY16_07165 [Planctomycetes bacterium]|jgi:ABC-type transporter Mla subunit MlaD|nr:hypothetical protein [Phycisphaerae bacterium]NBB95505.1 hypothetical protein [Planctomycetota bacterium]
MPRKEHNELKAGIFVIAAAAILLGVIVWVGAADWFQQSAGEAYLYIDAETGPVGLQPNYPVKWGDIEIGTIREMRADVATGRTIYIVVFHDPMFKMHADGKAKVAAGLLGGASIAIQSLGTDEAPPANVEHPVKLEAGLSGTFDKIDTMADMLTNELDVKRKQSLMFGIKATIAQLKTASEKIATMMTDLAPELDPKTDNTIAADLKRTMHNLANSSETIDQYVQDDLGKLLSEFRNIATSILVTATNLQDTTGHVKMLMASNYDNIDEMIANMTLVSANLKAASKEIRRNPWRLLQQPSEKKLQTTDIYDAARAFDSGATQLDSALAKLKSLKRMDTDDPEVQTQLKRVRQHLLESFKEFQKVEQRLWEELQKASQ